MFLSTSWKVQGEVLGAIGSMVSGIISVLASLIASGAQAIGGFATSVLDGIKGLVTDVLGQGQQMTDGMTKTVSTLVSDAVQEFAALPGKVKDAFGDLSSYLFESGRALMKGFIKGIKDMISAAADAAKEALSAVRDYFPSSPAKRGPFSGKGWTTYSGRALIEGFAEGIDDSAGKADSATRRVMKSAADNLEHYRRDLRTAGARNEQGGGTTVDSSIHVGTIVAADPEKPLDEIKRMQLRKKLREGKL